MLYLKVLEGGTEGWFKDGADREALAKKHFDPEKSPQSVYEVASSLKEARAIAAHYLTRGLNNISVVWALRIWPQPLVDLGIEVQCENGETGVADIDASHRNLIGPHARFVELAHRLLVGLQNGADVLRRLDKFQLEVQLHRFLKETGGGVSAFAQGRCRKALNLRQSAGQPVPQVAEVTLSEVYSGPFLDDAVPTRTQIELRAFEKYCARGREHGKDVADWFEAERELKEEHFGKTRASGSRSDLAGG